MAKKPPQKMVFTGFPAGFLKWLEKPIDEAFSALNSVPNRPETYRQWVEVNRAVRNLAVTVQALRKLAAWIGCDSAPPIDASSGRVNTPIKWRSRSFLRTRRHRQ